MTEEKLVKLKKRIDKAKSTLSELKGRQKASMDTLKKKWKCSTIDEAAEKIQTLKIEKRDLKEKRENGIRKLQKDFDL